MIFMAMWIMMPGKREIFFFLPFCVSTTKKDFRRKQVGSPKDVQCHDAYRNQNSHKDGQMTRVKAEKLLGSNVSPGHIIIYMA